MIVQFSIYPIQAEHQSPEIGKVIQILVVLPGGSSHAIRRGTDRLDVSHHPFAGNSTSRRSCDLLNDSNMG